MTVKYLYTNAELNLPHHLNYVAALPCKMHSAHRAHETVDLLRQETPHFVLYCLVVIIQLYGNTYDDNAAMVLIIHQGNCWQLVIYRLHAVSSWQLLCCLATAFSRNEWSATVILEKDSDGVPSAMHRCHTRYHQWYSLLNHWSMYSADILHRFKTTTVCEEKWIRIWIIWIINGFIPNFVEFGQGPVT